MNSLVIDMTPPTNSNKDEAGEYSKTYFRIDTDAYHFDKGFDANKEAAFAEEARKILESQGWTLIPPRFSSASPEAVKGNSHLYLHPMNFSGVCENDERKKLFEALKAARVFSCRGVDVYDEVFDMNDEQLDTKLQEEKDDIISELLEVLTTKRSNLYYTDVGFLGIGGRIAKRHSIKRLAIEGQRSNNGIDKCTDGICFTFVQAVMNELIEEGKIVSSETKNGLGYRTAKKGELKNRNKIKEAVS